MCFYYVSQWKICQVEPDTEPKLSYPILLQKPVLLQKEDEVLSSILQKKKKMFLEVIIFFFIIIYCKFVSLPPILDHRLL